MSACPAADCPLSGRHCLSVCVGPPGAWAALHWDTGGSQGTQSPPGKMWAAVHRPEPAHGSGCEHSPVRLSPLVRGAVKLPWQRLRPAGAGARTTALLQSSARDRAARSAYRTRSALWGVARGTLGAGVVHRQQLNTRCDGVRKGPWPWCHLIHTGGAAILHTGFDTQNLKSTLSHFCKALNIS